MLIETPLPPAAPAPGSLPTRIGLYNGSQITNELPARAFSVGWSEEAWYAADPVEVSGEMRSAHKLLYAGGALGVAAVGFWGIVESRTGAAAPQQISDERVAFLAAVGAAWSGEGRLVGLASPGAPGARWGADGRAATALGVLSRVKRVAATRVTGEILADRALEHLFLQQWDDAVRSLRQAARLAPADARWQSDLSAAYLARAAAASEPADLVEALAAAQRACRLDPTLPEAQYNLAVALESLHVAWRALPTWRRYLELDPSSAWAAEARRRERGLAGPGEEAKWQAEREVLRAAALASDTARVERIVRRFAHRARRFAEVELLASWADHSQAGDLAAARRALVIAQAVGRQLAAAGGDRLLLDAVAAIERAESTPSTAGVLRDLRLGLTAYRQGVALFDSVGHAAARADLTAARDHLRRAGSPLALWVEVYLAASAFQTFRYDTVHSALDAVERAAEPRDYLTLQARVHWLRGLLHFLRSEYESAALSYQAGLELCARTGDVEHAAVLQGLLAEYFILMHDDLRAWRHLRPALAHADRIAEPRRRGLLLLTAAIAALELGMPEVASYFQDEVVQATIRSRQPAANASFALVGRATYRQAVGRTEEAAKDLDLAARYARRIADHDVRLGALGEVWLAEGRLLRDAAPERALASFSRALEALIGTEDVLRLAQVHLDRARVLVRLGRHAVAEADLLAAIGLVETQRHRVPEHDRVSFYDASQEIYREMASLQVILGDWRRAFEFAERAQAPALEDLLTPAAAAGRGGPPPTTPPLTIVDTQAQVPPGAALLEYSVGERQLLLWVVARDGFWAAALPLGREQLAQAVDELRRAIEQGDGVAAKRLGAQLGSTLTGDLGPQIARYGRLVIVPSGSLHRLPFAALFDSGRERYWFAGHELEHAPSARLGLAAARRGGDRAAAGSTLLYVTRPAPNQVLFAHLAELAPPKDLAPALTTLYPQSEVLAGAAATPGALLDRVGRYEVVQIDAHVLPSARTMDTRIVLSPADGEADAGVLYPRQLLGRRFAKTRLVVLGGCGTATGRLSATEGSLSLARSVLGAGVPAVVASLWDVEDLATSFFTLELHRRLATGAPPARALREVQMLMSDAGDQALREPAVWAAFAVFTASAPEHGRQREPREVSAR